jgi:TRAP-type C4-dicarboxylate transport system permease small subunit
MMSVSFDKFVGILERNTNRVSNILMYISMSMLFIMMLLGAADVCGRYFFSKPITGTLEISEIMLPAIVLLAAANTQSVGGHVTVDILYFRLSPRVQAWIGFFTSMFLLVLFALATWQGVNSSLLSMQMNRVVPLIKLPIFIPQFLAPIGTFALCLVMAVQMLQYLIKIKKEK